jgi:pimeloyl-ACP methyl ester carboxylesterase
MDDGVMTARPDGLRKLWYADCTDADIAWAAAQLRPHVLAGVPSSIERPAWRAVPTTYVICRHDGSLTQEYLEAAAARVGRSVAWSTSHSPMLSRPGLVADLLTDIAETV